MKAAIYSETGPSSVIHITDVPDPTPGPGQVRVKIAYSGVNPTDWKSRAYQSVDFDYQIPNQDGSGTIDQVGEGVDASRIGERVWLYLTAYKNQFGSAAEYAVIPAQNAVKLPDNIDFAFGAELGVPFFTAAGTLFADGEITGKTVLIAGGAGAVGNAAIQVAKYAGATVITTVSSDEKAKLADQAGADLIVNYKDKDAAKQIKDFAPNGVDRVIEVAPTSNMELNTSVLGHYGTVISYAGEPTEPTIPVRQSMTHHWKFSFFLEYTMTDEDKQKTVDHLTDGLKAGVYKQVLPIHTYALDETAKAHDAVEQFAVGKVLIKVS